MNTQDHTSQQEKTKTSTLKVPVVYGDIQVPQTISAHLEPESGPRKIEIEVPLSSVSIGDLRAIGARFVSNLIEERTRQIAAIESGPKQLTMD